MADWHRTAGTRVTSTDWTGAVWFFSYSTRLGCERPYWEARMSWDCLLSLLCDFPLPSCKNAWIMWHSCCVNLFWNSLSVLRVSIEGCVDMKAVASLAAVTLFLRGPRKRSSRPCLKNISPKGINQASQTILLPINVTNGASSQS